MERTPVSQIEGLALSIRRATKEETYEWANGYLIVYRRDTLEKVATVHEDHIFDENGNHFVRD
ncbi:hypothetical protein Cp1R7AA1_052 [Mesorhizobium phage Cp1R7A-A1]|nr:hypothetical protein Cp1R7AA1_052 [Mesorhizobium phage Cp1R7A-A1]